MKEGPDIAQVAALIGDPARANMLTALMTGQALTASELAAEAGVTPQTASAHLAKMQAGGLVTLRKSGRHRYFAISGDDVGAMLETLMTFAESRGHTRLRPGPKDSALREARVCYDHLAGEMGVAMFDHLTRNRLIEDGLDLWLTAEGRQFVRGFGIDVDALDGARRPVCRSCLDWSVRRTHLAGGLGAALLSRVYDLGWASREEGTRIVRFTANGQAAFRETFR